MDQSTADDHIATRRRLLGKAALAAPLVAVGTTMAPLSRFFPAAWAQGNGPTDYDLVGFATSMELAIVSLYEQASAKLPADQAAVAAIFQGHHREHASTFSGFFDAANVAAPKTPNPRLVSDFTPKVTAGGDATITALGQLEELAAATHFWAIGIIENTAGAGLFSKVMPVAGQQAVAWELIAGGQPSSAVPNFQTDAAKITPADYPAPAPAPGEAGSGPSGATGKTS